MKVKQFFEKFRDKIFLFSLLFFMTVAAQAQKKVSGSVSSGGMPLPGANVVAKGHQASTATDIDGKFNFTVPNNATTLVVSFVGYKTEEVAITSGEMNISLS